MLFRSLISFIQDQTYRNLTISAASAILSGTILFHFLEGWGWLDSLYFSVITLTTVGYGDFVPRTDAGKIASIVFIISGIGIMFGFVNAFYEHRVSKREEYRRKRKGS